MDEELVGGDFYDIFQLHEGRYGVVMADVSGKGLKAAVYTAMTKYMLRAYALRESDPKSVLARLNDALTSCTPPEVFVTLVYAIIDEQARTLVYAMSSRSATATPKGLPPLWMLQDRHSV